MTLGEKIFKLRTAQKMSQGDLAEKLNVSRQSISKWETNASVPELDKLIQLSDLFQISLDALVRDEEIQNGRAVSDEKQEPPPRQEQTAFSHPLTTQKIVGFILLGFGLLCCLLALSVVGNGLLVIGGYIIFCSLICLLMKRYAGLVIGWVTMIQAILLTPFFTGVRMFSVFRSDFYFRNHSINDIVAVLLWILLGLLIFFTAKAIVDRKRKS